jgi:uncharacterized membrane protein
MMSFASVVVTVLLILYPVLVYLGLSYSRISAVAVLLIVVSIARLVLRGARIGPFAASAPWISAGGVLLAGTVLLKGTADAMLFYPVFVNLVLFGVFVHSLIYPPTLITRLASIREPDLTQSAIRYTRNVTVIWSIFFLINGSISLYTALWTTAETWTLYNGLVAYLLIGALIGGEWLLRARFKG